ncbi:MAG TPA: hypothetical protein VG738_03300 [Chitinophagaceae bacterium]|nr:hypothetical protein [Chitinophagaceae bacterium]
MEYNFTILWNGSRIFVDLREDTPNNPVYVLHTPRKRREIVNHIDELGVEHWLERGKGETTDSAQIGALIEMAMYQHSSHWGI